MKQHNEMNETFHKPFKWRFLIIIGICVGSKIIELHLSFEETIHSIKCVRDCTKAWHVSLATILLMHRMSLNVQVGITSGFTSFPRLFKNGSHIA